MIHYLHNCIFENVLLNHNRNFYAKKPRSFFLRNEFPIPDKILKNFKSHKALYSFEENSYSSY